ncbi:hypothetical protein [Bacillus swezeyi]|uniref:Uncharacterized protein n=1 Tax=Bacillus swezeyi TaxID=1925020 RepID=A0A5M8RLT7_9BACI|nr:hypothetical protein [Bacillus swezeyi]KAA6446892.1 hypothetical protein DX927_22835 [Bacillus swezeyi]KAA6471460.1 hypothetical protein DX928_23075 [Bacillus swezeyi]
MNDSLKDLFFASYISRGELVYRNDRIELINYFNKEKAYFLYNYIESNGLEKYIRINSKNSKMTIVVDQNCKDQETLIMLFLGTLTLKSPKVLDFISLHTALVLINLFGQRKVEGISVNTHLHAEKQKILSHVLSKRLNTLVVPTKNHLLLPYIRELVIENLPKCEIVNALELANYMTKSEINELNKNHSAWEVSHETPLDEFNDPGFPYHYFELLQ